MSAFFTTPKKQTVVLTKMKMNNSNMTGTEQQQQVSNHTKREEEDEGDLSSGNSSGNSSMEPATTNSSSDTVKNEGDEDDDEEDDYDNDTEEEANEEDEDNNSGNDSAQGVQGGLRWPSDDSAASRSSSLGQAAAVVQESPRTGTCPTTALPRPAPTLVAATTSSGATSSSSGSEEDSAPKKRKVDSMSSLQKSGTTKTAKRQCTTATPTPKPKYNDPSTSASDNTNNDNHNQNPDATTTSSSDSGDSQKLDDMQRETRNAREKRRSNQICDQFDKIRDLMVASGVIVPKGTKGTILSAAREYILLLQKRQEKIAMENCLLVHQMQQIGNGDMGTPAAAAVRHCAAKNGAKAIIWAGQEDEDQEDIIIPIPSPVSRHQDSHQRCQKNSSTKKGPDFSAAFQNCPVPMAIANLGGTFIECNAIFCQLIRQSKKELLTQTIFNLTAREDLQDTFEKISQWLTPLSEQQEHQSCLMKPVVVRTAAVCNKSLDENDNYVDDYPFQLCLTPIKDNQDKTSMRFVCVTLIQEERHNMGTDLVVLRESSSLRNKKGGYLHNIVPISKRRLPTIIRDPQQSLSCPATKRGAYDDSTNENDRKQRKKPEFFAIG